MGLGPRAKSIQEDQLKWRRLETERLGGLLEKLTSERNTLSAEIAGIKAGIQNQFAAAAEAQARRIMDERQRVAALKRQVQQEQVEEFAGQQSSLRQSISSQIDTLLENLKSLQRELTRLSDDEGVRVAALRAEPRRDLLSQTLALHGLFVDGQQGGSFALGAYLVLALLFMLVDTIPIIVKFFSRHGPYDNLVDCDEVRFDGDRKAFISSLNRYMERLSAGELSHIQRHALVEGSMADSVERTWAGREFLEHILRMEQSFQEKIGKERRELKESGESNQGERLEMLDQLSQTFYRDLKAQMDRFFALRAGAASE